LYKGTVSPNQLRGDIDAKLSRQGLGKLAVDTTRELRYLIGHDVGHEGKSSGNNLFSITNGEICVVRRSTPVSPKERLFCSSRSSTISFRE
jgi:hypothetical protein